MSADVKRIIEGAIDQMNMVEAEEARHAQIILWTLLGSIHDGSLPEMARAAAKRSRVKLEEEH